MISPFRGALTLVSLLSALSLVTTTPAVAQLTTRTVKTLTWVQSVAATCSSGDRLSIGGVTIQRTESSCAGGYEIRGTIVLERAAPSEGIQPYAETSLPAVASVWTERIAEGGTRGLLLVRTNPVTADTTVTVSVWTSSADRKSTAVTIVPPHLTKVTLTEAQPLVGRPEVLYHGTVHFSGPPASATAVLISLQRDLPQVALQYPFSFYLPLNSLSAPFAFSVTPVGTPMTATITARSGTVTAALPVTIRPPLLNGFGGTTEDTCHVPCRVGLNATLDAPAPVGGAPVALSATAPVLINSSFTIPAGNTHAGWQIKASVEPSSSPYTAVLGGTSSSTVTASYAGASLSRTLYIKGKRKGDFHTMTPVFKDRFGNVISKIPDSYPIKACMEVMGCRLGSDGWTWDCFSHEGPGFEMEISYVNNQGTGRSFTLPIDFPIDGSIYWGTETIVTMVHGVDVCAEIPGLANPGDYYDVEFIADPKNLAEEFNESNNKKSARIYR